MKKEERHGALLFFCLSFSFGAARNAKSGYRKPATLMSGLAAVFFRCGSDAHAAEFVSVIFSIK